MTPKQSPGTPTSSVPAEPTLHLIRGQRVIIDSDLAAMYGVPTKRFNEAFKRNQERFPQDFAFRLTQDEVLVLRSQFATSKILSVTKPLDGRGGRRNLPWVFTEHGAVMAANILKGEHAVRMSVFVFLGLFSRDVLLNVTRLRHFVLARRGAQESSPLPPLQQS